MGSRALMGALGLAVSGTSKHQKTKLDAIKDLRRSTLAIARPALFPKIVAQTLQRFSPGWLSPDLEAGVSESPSGQKFGEQIYKQLQPSQRGATRHGASVPRLFYRSPHPRLAPCYPPEAVATLAIRTELRGKNFAVMAHRTRHGNRPARLSIFVIRGVTDAEHPPISDCLSG